MLWVQHLPPQNKDVNSAERTRCSEMEMAVKAEGMIRRSEQEESSDTPGAVDVTGQHAQREDSPWISRAAAPPRPSLHFKGLEANRFLFNLSSLN